MRSHAIVSTLLTCLAALAAPQAMSQCFNPSDCDLDGYSPPEDCDDTDPLVYPGAPQQCDGRAHDCNAPGWPMLPPGYSDQDGDGYAECPKGCEVRVSSWATAEYDWTGGSSWNPAIASMGTHLAVVWREEFDVAYRLMVSILDESGRTVVPSRSISMAVEGNSGVSGPALAWSGRELGVAWKNSITDIAFARLSPSGALLGESDLVASGAYVTPPAMLWNGSEYGLFWATALRDYQDCAGYRTGIYFTRIDVLGRRVAGDTLLSLTCGSPEGDRRVDASWNGSEYAIVLGNSFARLSADGSKIGEDVPFTQAEYLAWAAGHVTHASPSAAASGDARVGFVWVRSDPMTGNTEIMLSQVGLDGQLLLPDQEMSHNPASSAMPALAWTGRDFAVAWIDERDGSKGFRYHPGEVYFRLANCQDCNDQNARAYPGALELPGNFTDENCDGSLDPCSPLRPWRNHGDFLSCVQSACSELVGDGELTSRECGVVISEAAKSKVGGRR